MMMIRVKKGSLFSHFRISLNLRLNFSESDDYLPDDVDMEIDNQYEREFVDYELKSTKSRGRPKKTFESLTSRSQKLERLRPIFQSCVQFCQSENLEFYELLGSLGKLYYFKEKNDPLLAKLFKKIEAGENPLIKHSMTVERSLCFKNMCRLGMTSKFFHI